MGDKNNYFHAKNEHLREIQLSSSGKCMQDLMLKVMQSFSPAG